MARRTHPPASAKHDRAHIRLQAGRWRRRRLRRMLDTDPVFLAASAWREFFEIGDPQPPHAWRYMHGGVMPAALQADLDRLAAGLDELRTLLTRYGQSGPLWHIPATVLAALDPAVRNHLITRTYRPARVEQLDRRGRYGRRTDYVDDPWDFRSQAHPSRRAREQRAWRADTLED